MIDLKEQYQERADELAEELYGVEFYDLTEAQKDEIWAQAEQDVIDNNVERAERRCGK